MAAPEYAEIGSVRLNATGYPGWCDFDVSAIPCWGTRTMKGQPSINIPHAQGDLATTVHRAGVTFTMLGTVYGDYNQSNVKQVGLENCRKQLADNLAALMALMDGTLKTFNYKLYSRTYTGQVTVIDMQSAADPGDSPIVQKTVLKLHLPAGLLTGP